ncbi:MAG: AAA family ATPase, partial [Bacteroidota bacterium]|nr:AAA family ATPase [Bacteroidota bacterium]
MFRNIRAKLQNWKDAENRKPLLVRGARQVGKSYSISEFGKKHFEGDVHILNFEKYPEAHAIFEQNFDVNRIISELELFLNARIVAGEDL